jgi:glycine/D-amino acid oxidase-like deaminating enzyme
MGVRYKSVCIDVPRYLQYLFERIQFLGARVIKGTFDTNTGLAGAIASAKQIIKSHGVMQEVDIVINCTGLSARLFVGGEESEKMFPIRGQTVLVKGEASLARTFTDFGSNPEELLYVIPRPGSNTTILGGCKQVGNWDEKIDEGLNKRMLGRVKEFRLAEELRTGVDGQFEVLSTQIGFRPGRKGGPRVEIERVGEDWVVHSYGHGGGGYQCSVGCAEEVVGLIQGLEKGDGGVSRGH